VPRRSDVTISASRSSFRWCETVDWLRPSALVKSHTQTSSAARAKVATMRKRAGSASALRRRASASRSPAKISASGQLRSLDIARS
jgi:hypothetical protein